MEAKAYLKNLRISAKKVRLVAGLIRRQNVDVAIAQLRNLNKKSSSVMIKLIESAVANAKNNLKVDTDKQELYIKDIQVDMSTPYKRWSPAAMGVAHPIKKHGCHISLILGDREKVATAKNKKLKKDKK